MSSCSATISFPVCVASLEEVALLEDEVTEELDEDDRDLSLYQRRQLLCGGCTGICRRNAGASMLLPLQRWGIRLALVPLSWPTVAKWAVLI